MERGRISIDGHFPRFQNRRAKWRRQEKAEADRRRLEQERAEAERRRREQEAAATRIQASYRGFKERQALKDRKRR